MANNNSNRGRTFWDLIAEHPKMMFSVVLALLIVLLILALNNYSIKSSMLSVEAPIGITPVSKDSFSVASSDTLPLKKVSTPIPYRKSNKLPTSRQPTRDTVKTQIVNVSSNNQSGGITANQVNFEAIPRKLNESIANQLLSNLHDKNENISITSVMGDGEAFRYASEITTFLKGKGFNRVDGVSQAVFTKPVLGQFFDRDSTGVKIVVGTRKSQ